MERRLAISAILAAAIAILFFNPVSFAENKKCSGRACTAPSQIKTGNPAKDTTKYFSKKQSTTKISQKPGSVLFDGADPNLAAKDFGPAVSNPVALTGGGLLLDLKGTEPDLNKISPLTDFSLDKPTTLPASAKPVLLPQKAYAAGAVNSWSGYDVCKQTYDLELAILNANINMYTPLLETLREALSLPIDCSNQQSPGEIRECFLRIAGMKATAAEYEQIIKEKTAERDGKSLEGECGEGPSPEDKALELLRTSPEGAKIADFIAEKGVKIIYSDSLPQGSQGVYNPGTNTIMLPLSAKDWPTIQLAVAIGHEGFHAEQNIDHNITTAIELEQNAKFMGMVVYDEMIKAGAEKLPDNNPVEKEYKVFKDFVKDLNVQGFDKYVKGLYAGQVKNNLMNELLKGKLGFTQPFWRWYYTHFDTPGLGDSETVKEQQNKWFVSDERKKKLDNTLNMYLNQVLWELGWMKKPHEELSKEAK